MDITQKPTETVTRVFKKAKVAETATLVRTGDRQCEFVINLGGEIGEIRLSTKRQIKDRMKELRHQMTMLRKNKRNGSKAFRTLQAYYRLFKFALTEFTRYEVHDSEPSLRAIKAAIHYYSAELKRARILLAETKLTKEGIRMGAFRKMNWKLDREFSGEFSISSPRLSYFPGLPQEVGNVMLQSNLFFSTRSGEVVIHSKRIDALLRFIKDNGLACTTTGLEKKATMYEQMMKDITLALETVKH